ncbi:MAG: dynamin family protein [Fusobacteriaceae bacterium]
MANIYVEDNDKIFELVGEVCKNGDTDSLTEIDFKINELKKIIDNELIEFSKEYAIKNLANLMTEFDYELEKFYQFLRFPKFSKKNTIGLGGGFSAGKSSFINSFFNRKRLLPAKTSPTTSIPTFLINGEEDKVNGINIFNQKVQLNSEALEVLNHYSKDNINFSFSHILKSIFIEIPEIKYENLIFLDTPGYSKSDEEHYNENTDENIAKIQLNNCNYILWFIDADNGTIKEEDVKFLNEIDKKIPVFILVTKADKKQTDIVDIIQNIKGIVLERGLNVIDIIPFSSRKKELFPLDILLNLLEKWNNQKIELLYAKNFKKLFLGINSHIENSIKNYRKRLDRVNKSLVFSESEDINECLGELKSDIQYNLKKLCTGSENLIKLKNEFFSNLKMLGDIVGIPLPEPNEIELIEEITDINTLLSATLKEMKIKELDYSLTILKEFEEVDIKELFIFDRDKIERKNIENEILSILGNI